MILRLSKFNCFCHCATVKNKIKCSLEVERWFFNCNPLQSQSIPTVTVSQSPIENWGSPRLGVRFDLSGPELQIYRPDGQRFLSYVEIAQQAEQERQRAERLAERLRELGVDPDQIV